MPKAGNSVYRKSLFRRNPYPNLLERAPLPDLVALHENGTLFSNPRVMTERAKEEEVARMANSTLRSKVNGMHLFFVLRVRGRSEILHTRIRRNTNR